MAYLRLPDNSYFTIPEGKSPQEAYAIARQKYPEAFEPPKPKDTGFTGALKASTEELKGDVAALLGRTGLMDEAKAEAYREEKQKAARDMFAPTEEGWADAPFLKARELLGGSLPYVAAPIAAAGAVAAAPLTGTAATVAGLGAGLAAGATQYTATNLGRQMDEGAALKDTDLLAAGAAAIPQAALDTLSLRLIPGVGRIFGAAGKKITPEMAKEIAQQGMLKTAGAYALQGGKTAGIEGSTEVAQQFLERLQAGLDISDEKARDEYFESFIGGAVLGGTLSVPGKFMERGGAKQMARAEEQRLQLEADAKAEEQRQAEIEATEVAKLVAEQQKTLGKPEDAAAGIQGTTGNLFGEKPITKVSALSGATDTTTVRERERAAQEAGVEARTPQDVVREYGLLKGQVASLETRLTEAADKGDVDTVQNLAPQLQQARKAFGALSSELKSTAPIEQNPEVQLATLNGQLKNKIAELQKTGGAVGNFEKMGKLATEIKELQAKIAKIPYTGPDLIGQAEQAQAAEVAAEGEQRWQRRGVG
jgi:hypothetical protein